MKRISFSMILVVFLFIFLSGCGAESSAELQSGAEDTSTTETVIVDQDGVTVTYLGAKLEQYLPGQKDGYALYVTLKIENGTDKGITLYPGNSSVNDVIKPALSGVPMSVLPGKTASSTLFFTNLSDAGIDSVDDMDKVTKIEFSLTANDNETNDTLLETDLISLLP